MKKWRTLAEGQRRLFVYGQITYRDIHRNRYRTLFSAQFLQPRFPASQAVFPKPEWYNRHYTDGPEDSEL